MTFVSHVPMEAPSEEKLESDSTNILSQYEDSVASHLVTLLQSDQHSEVISSAK